jgi:hypothetical protein
MVPKRLKFIKHTIGKEIVNKPMEQEYLKYGNPLFSPRLSSLCVILGALLISTSM